MFVRLAKGVSAAAGLANLQHIADAANKAIAADPDAAGNDGVSVLGVQRPAQIVNYRTHRGHPAGPGRRARRRGGPRPRSHPHRLRPAGAADLALLKALGFTRRQLSAAIAWQSTVAAVIGVVVGTPLGIVIGRQLWILFARNLDAVPDPTAAGRRCSSSR